MRNAFLGSREPLCPRCESPMGQCYAKGSSLPPLLRAFGQDSLQVLLVITSP